MREVTKWARIDRSRPAASVDQSTTRWVAEGDGEGDGDRDGEERDSQGGGEAGRREIGKREMGIGIGAAAYRMAHRAAESATARGTSFLHGRTPGTGADVPVSLDPRSSGRQPPRVYATRKQPTPSEHARTRTLISRLPASPPPCESSLLFPLFRSSSSSAQQAGAADGATRRGRPASR